MGWFLGTMSTSIVPKIIPVNKYDMWAFQLRLNYLHTFFRSKQDSWFYSILRHKNFTWPTNEIQLQMVSQWYPSITQIFKNVKYKIWAFQRRINHLHTFLRWKLTKYQLFMILLNFKVHAKMWIFAFKNTLKAWNFTAM